MIKELLQQRYPSEYDLPCEKIEVFYKVLSNSVVFSDDKACMQCHQRFIERATCNEENLKINFGNNSVISINFESYIGQFDHTKAEITERCDYLLVDDKEHTKIAFCDLTCSEEKYVNDDTEHFRLGKRAKAIKQVKNSLEQLLRVALFDHYLLTFPQKVGLFGWRDYNAASDINDMTSAEKSMLTFMETPSSMSQTLRTKCIVVGHNFEFVQVKYPTVYNW